MIESGLRDPSAMPSEISVLLRVQELDQRIGELTSEIDNLPRHVASIKAHLAAHRQALERTQAILAENGKERRHLESQVGDHKQKIAKLQDQMNGAKTNEQFRAFQHEIQFCKDAIDQFEERILENMEQAETLQTNVSKAVADLDVEEAKVARDVKVASARIETDKQERTQKQLDRKAAVAQVSPSTMQAYERIRRVRGTAVAPVIDESCGACHVRVRPKVLQDLRHLTDRIFTCESCGLIVYLPGTLDDGVQIEDPAGDMAPTRGA